MGSKYHKGKELPSTVRYACSHCGVDIRTNDDGSKVWTMEQTDIPLAVVHPPADHEVLRRRFGLMMADKVPVFGCTCGAMNRKARRAH